MESNPSATIMPFCELLRSFVIDKTRKVKFLYNTIQYNKIPLVKKDYDSTKIYRKTHKKGASTCVTDL